ncbi:hypothetical protein DFH06DRAFT_1483240 [Mycena polygramma]|nr:hypothetical protein DFH06DRAFT_1483240 [Mycena polygramma]
MPPPDDPACSMARGNHPFQCGPPREHLRWPLCHKHVRRLFGRLGGRREGASGFLVPSGRFCWPQTQ